MFAAGVSEGFGPDAVFALDNQGNVFSRLVLFLSGKQAAHAGVGDPPHDRHGGNPPREQQGNQHGSEDSDQDGAFQYGLQEVGGTRHSINRSVSLTYGTRSRFRGSSQRSTYPSNIIAIAH